MYNLNQQLQDKSQDYDVFEAKLVFENWEIQYKSLG